MQTIKEDKDERESPLSLYLKENWKAFYESSIAPEPLMGGIG